MPHIDGIRIPRSPFSRAQRDLLARASSTSQQIGTIATPARRSGAIWQNSASQRLWARAPAHCSSGVDALGRQREARAEGRHVHLGDAVGKDHLARDAVGVEHLDALRRGPRRP